MLQQALSLAACGTAEIEIHAFITQPLDEGEWTASHSLVTMVNELFRLLITTLELRLSQGNSVIQLG
jgi:hypothetical protein